MQDVQLQPPPTQLSSRLKTATAKAMCFFVDVAVVPCVSVARHMPQRLRTQGFNATMVGVHRCSYTLQALPPRPNMLPPGFLGDCLVDAARQRRLLQCSRGWVCRLCSQALHALRVQQDVHFQPPRPSCQAKLSASRLSCSRESACRLCSRACSASLAGEARWAQDGLGLS